MTSSIVVVLAATAFLAVNGPSGTAAELPAGTFVEVTRSEEGGHFFSQLIYAPSAEALVSWGTAERVTRSGRTCSTFVEEGSVAWFFG